MSDTAIAILILPLLAAVVLVTECSRIGCTRLKRHLQNGETFAVQSRSTSR